MRLTMISAPVGFPVSVAQAKLHARIDADDEDSLIEALIAAAVNLLDGPTGILGRAIVTQTWLLELPAWPASLVIPVEPVQSLSVSYLDADGIERGVDPGDHYTTANPGQAPILYWSPGWTAPIVSADNPFPVRVEIVAGYGDAAAVPPALAQAIKMMVAHWYATRETVVIGTITAQVPLAVDALIAPFRRLL